MLLNIHIKICMYRHTYNKVICLWPFVVNIYHFPFIFLWLESKLAEHTHTSATHCCLLHDAACSNIIFSVHLPSEFFSLLCIHTHTHLYIHMFICMCVLLKFIVLPTFVIFLFEILKSNYLFLFFFAMLPAIHFTNILIYLNKFPNYLSMHYFYHWNQ